MKGPIAAADKGPPKNAQWVHLLFIPAATVGESPVKSGSASSICADARRSARGGRLICTFSS